MGPLSPVALQCPGGLGGRRLSQFLQPTSLGAPALWRSGPGSLLPPRPPRISLVPMSTQAEPLPSCPPWSTLTQESVGLPMSIFPFLPALCLYEGSTWPLALAAWSSSFLPYILYAQLPLLVGVSYTSHPCSCCTSIPAGLLRPWLSAPSPIQR